jgi:hypothetical protein
MSSRVRFFKKIMDAKSANNAVSDELSPADLVSVNELTYYIVFGAGTGAGAVQPESAHVAAYAGTWAAEGSPVAWSAADKVHKVSITGASFVARCRISTGVTGGTVDVWALGLD